MVNSVYWSLVTTGYLGWSFATGKWNITWFLWVIAGILSAPVSVLAKKIGRRK